MRKRQKKTPKDLVVVMLQIYSYSAMACDPEPIRHHKKVYLGRNR